MTRTSALVICGALAFSGAAVASAVDSWSLVAQDKTKTTQGTVKSVDTTKKTFVISTGIGNDKKDVTVTVNDSTTYMLDGVSSTMEKALAVGNTAKVKHVDGLASSVDAKTPKKPG